MKYCLKQDNDPHWYLIPVKLSEKFDIICDVSYVNDDFKNFDKLFGQMRINSPFTLIFEKPKNES